MKKAMKKLALNRETLSHLTLTAAIGGAPLPAKCTGCDSTCGIISETVNCPVDI